MTDKQIRTFLRLADTLNFSATAEQLYLTQQAVTRQIAALEAELGFKLFLRSTRHVQLTEAGMQFRQEMAELNRRMDNCIARIRASLQPQTPTLRIAFLRQYPRARLIVPLMAELEKSFPALHFEVKLLNFSELRRELAEGKQDLCVTTSSDWRFWPHSIVHVLEENPFCVLYSRCLGLPEPFQMESLAQVPQLRLQEPFLTEGLKPDDEYLPHGQVIWCENLETMLLRMEAGYGYTVAPHCFEGEDSPNLRFEPIDHPQAAGQIICAMHEDNTHPYLQPVSRRIVQYFQQNSYL